MKIEFIEKIKAEIGSDNVLLNEPLGKHTTFKIGGPCELMAMPHSEAEVSDKGIRGVVIRLLDNFADISAYGEIIEAQAGAYLSRIGSIARNASLAGFEFASGIPGTVGGACVMNAGAYGGELKDVLISVRAMDEEGNIKDYYPQELEMGYRTSIFAKGNFIVLSAKIKLVQGNFADVDDLMKDLAARRRDKQPLELPSAGSTFKRPEGYFAGKLIMDAGLSGYRVGDAAVSTKHCGFVVNLGNATAQDVLSLINDVSDKVFEQYGVRLEPEVKMLGEF